MEDPYSSRKRMLGLTIAYYRKLSGMTQIQLADRLGISRTHISNLEAPNMNTSISLNRLYAIADALGIPVYKLFLAPNEEPHTDQ